MTFEEMWKNVKCYEDLETPSDYSGVYDIEPLPLPRDYSIVFTQGRWLGTGVSELMLNNNKPMLEKAEKMLELAGNIPAMQSKIDTLASKVEKMKMISPDDYVECEKCGVLVNKNKAQLFSSVEEKRESSIYLYFTFSGTEQHFGKEAVLHHLCQHCDMKKFKKENKY